jgi:uncharacterized protein (TIGR02145 family)
MQKKSLLMTFAIFVFAMNLIAQSSQKSKENENKQSATQDSSLLLDFSKYDWNIKIAKNSKTVKTVTIGTQIWMAENLDVSTFRNGDAILEAKTKEEWQLAYDAKKPAWCYYNNDVSNGTKYGKLYNWHAVNDPRGLAPIGWKLPSVSDWKTLNLGLKELGGKKMKSTSGWNEGGNGTNESGFSALPGGIRLSSTDGFIFSVIGSEAHFWSSTGATIIGFDFGNGYELKYDDDYLRNNLHNQEGLSVRCIKSFALHPATGASMQNSY